ncbi:hypothetical protein LA06_16020, partial [Xanthomonas oryzae pv. oryzae]
MARVSGDPGGYEVQILASWRMAHMAVPRRPCSKLLQFRLTSGANAHSVPQAQQHRHVGLSLIA